ncbi:MAG: DUF4136 domain-containing protein [Bacteroidota bacterium]|nr:DUF4136 domain-containing protein [Bacteroidota bacterium]
MKKIVGIWLLSAGMICAAHAQNITVKSDRSLDTDFSKFKSFYWSTQADAWLDEGGLYFLNDLGMKAIIRDAVKGELMGLGYQLQSYEPDMIVNFRVFEKPVTLKGYDGYGLSYWGDERYREISDTTSYNVEAGTLLLSLADRKSGKVVWQGFASGLIENNAFVKDEGKIREAVNLIFEEFNQRASEYTRR